MIVKMRYLVLVYLAVAAVTAVENELDRKICEPGRLYKEDCNDCQCSNDGKSRVCTQMLCPSAVTSNSGDQIGDGVISVVERKICQPGRVYEEECNSCTCSSDGKSRICTQMLCPSAMREIEKNLCQPGRVYNEDCNSCTCSSDGKSRTCTQMLCQSAVITPNLTNDEATNAVMSDDIDKKICQPGRVYKEACNDCTCSSDGKSRVCTQKLCPPVDTMTPTASPLRRRRQVSHHKSCEPGKSFKMYCNTCTCGADGISVACTKQDCPPNMYNEDGSLKNVESDPTSPTLRRRRQLSQDKSCEPGKSFKMYCNTCTCGADGITVACTKKGCPPNMYNEDGSLKNVEQDSTSPTLRRRRQVSQDKSCEPGKSFKMYCNTCTCGADGITVACTKKDCPPNMYNEDGSLKNVESDPTSPTLRRRRQVSQDKSCEPGKSFKMYCNTCTCGADGITVACTKKGCPPNMYNEDGSLKNVEQDSTSPTLRRRRQVSQDKSCEPGKSFKHFCNTCTCAADGITVACTKQACPPNMFNEDGTLRNTEQVPKDNLLREKRQISYNRDCTPGESFKIDCNTCWCGVDGHSVACTKMACIPMKHQDGTLKNIGPIPVNSLLRRRRQVANQCEPGKSFKMDCNSCICTADGVPICTAMACGAFSKPNKDLKSV